MPTVIAPLLCALRADHLPLAVKLSSALGWPYREADWRFALELGHGIALESQGRLLGTALWWVYGERHASFGMIIVAAEMQGRGLGRALTEALLADAGDRSIILNSTVEGERLYAAQGFVPYGRIFQHQAVFVDAGLTPAPAGLRPFRQADADQVLSLDSDASGTDRSVLLKSLIKVGELWVVDRGQGIEGYACLREFGRGLVIGPVVASSDEDARALIATLAARHGGRFVRVDVTQQSGLSPWLAAIGLPRVGEALSMVRGPRATTRGNAHLHALSNQSFG